VIIVGYVWTNRVDGTGDPTHGSRSERLRAAAAMLGKRPNSQVDPHAAESESHLAKEAIFERRQSELFRQIRS
jgi:hypothetical protein